MCAGCHFQGVTYAEGQVLPGGERECQDCTCLVSETLWSLHHCGHCYCTHTIIFFLGPHREVRWCVCRDDALLCHVHTQLWTAASVQCAMVADLTDETVLMENDSHIRQTAASAAPVWYSTTYNNIQYSHQITDCLKM